MGAMILIRLEPFPSTWSSSTHTVPVSASRSLQDERGQRSGRVDQVGTLRRLLMAFWTHGSLLDGGLDRLQPAQPYEVSTTRSLAQASHLEWAVS